MGMVFAVNEINENSSLLPMTTIGYNIHDTCFNMPKTVKHSLQYMEQDLEENMICVHNAVVGTYGSTLALMMARLFGIYYIPQVRLR